MKKQTHKTINLLKSSCFCQQEIELETGVKKVLADGSIFKIENQMCGSELRRDEKGNEHKIDFTINHSKFFLIMLYNMTDMNDIIMTSV